MHWSVIDFLSVFRVPCFYFIAGYVLYLQLGRYAFSKKTLGTVIYQKFRQLIIPSVIFTFLPSFDFAIETLSVFNTGHYFLPALFIIILFFCIIYYITNIYRGRAVFAIFLLYGLGTTFLLSLFTHTPVENYFHWRHVLFGNLFFILGVISAAYNNVMLRLLAKPVIPVVLGVSYTLLYILMNNYLPGSRLSYMVVPIKRVVCPVLGIYFVVGLFVMCSKFFRSDNILGKLSYYIGQRTLPLYVIQNLIFFLVFQFIDTSALDSPQLFAVFTFVLSLLLALLFHEIICKVPLINCYVFGRKAPLTGFKTLFIERPAASRPV